MRQKNLISFLSPALSTNGRDDLGYHANICIRLALSTPWLTFPLRGYHSAFRFLHCGVCIQSRQLHLSPASSVLSALAAFLGGRRLLDRRYRVVVAWLCALVRYGRGSFLARYEGAAGDHVCFFATVHAEREGGG